MTRNEYNGWTNYETWLANLWMDNDEGAERYWRERAEVCCNEAVDAEEAAYALRQELEEDADERSAACPFGFVQDVVNAAMREVNWQEIAEHWIADSGFEWPVADESEAA